MRTLRTLMVGLALLTVAGPGWAEVQGLPVDVTVEKYVDITFATPTIAVTAANWESVATAGSQAGTIDANCPFTTVLSATSMTLPDMDGVSSVQAGGLATADLNPFYWDTQMTLNGQTASLGGATVTGLFTNSELAQTIAATPAGSYPVQVNVKVQANTPVSGGGTIQGGVVTSSGTTLTLTVTAD